MRHSIRRISMLAILALLAAIVPTAGPALAATFTVNTTFSTGATAADSSPGDGICQTSAGLCTLRAAIEETNALAGPDTIQFNIPTGDSGFNAGLGVWTIRPSGSLPVITGGGTTIDATTQPGGRASGPKIEVNGGLLATGIAGFRISSANNTIRGFVINSYNANFSNSAGFGIWLNDEASDSNTIRDNWIGLDAAGTSAAPNTNVGVSVPYGDSNVIRNNVISGNGSGSNTTNIMIGQVTDSDPFTADGNQVAGNLIGTNATGTAAVAGAPIADGVFVGSRVSNTLIGGATAADRNIISGHTEPASQTRAGLRIEGKNHANTTVQGNYIGTNLSGTAAVANDQGLRIQDDLDNLTISGNVIAGNTVHGVLVDAQLATITGITIQNNLIGLTAAGAPLGNGGSGVTLRRNPTFSGTVGVSQVTIRGNTISSNSQHGISVGAAAQSGSLYTGITIAGNAIGTAPGGSSGSLGLTNGQSGIFFFTGTGNTVGGATAADRNIIAARNNQTALRLSGANTTGTIVQGNYIGVASNGTGALLVNAAERAAFGVLVDGGSTNNTVGPNNVIGFNDSGVQLNGGSGNTVKGNNIGLAADNVTGIGNTQFGVWLLNSANNTIGGAAAADTNRITSHGRHGIFVDGASGGNTLVGNIVSSNLQNGIQLNSAGASGTVVDSNALSGNLQDGLRIIGATGVRITRTTTTNNTGSGIALLSGANGGRAAPTINASLTSGPGGVPRATGTATGCASPGCVIEIFTSGSREDGEGPRFLASGTADPTTGAFTIDVPGCDRFLTATARDPSTNNTSPFTTPMVDTISGCSAATPLLSAGTPVTSPASPRPVTGGTSVSYQHTLTNNGGLGGTFTLSASSSPAGWVTAIAPTSVTLGAGQSATVFITVTVPLNAVGGQVETTTVTASSGALSDSESNYSVVAQMFGVDIDGPRSVLFALSSGVQDVDFTHTITNTGNGTDTITINAVNATISGSPTFSVVGGNQCIGLAPGASCTKTIRVTLPASSTGGTFTVTANGGGGSTESVTDTAFTQSVIPQITTFARRDAFPSETVVFAHTVTNIGTQDGNFTPNLILPAPLDGWAVTTDAPASFFLAAGASRTINVTMVVPGISATGAISGTEKTATIQITATESGAQASANDTVRVRLQPQFTFSAATISPASGLPLSTVVFTHTLQNNSNGDDSYSITVTPSAGLENVTISPPSPVSVPRQGSVQVVIRARIRSGTAQSVGVEQLGVAVRSLSLPDPGTQNQTDAVTVLGAAVPSLSVTPGTRTANPGTAARFSYTLTNTGNQTGNFGAPAFTLPSAQPGWTATVVGGSPPACFTNLAAGATCTFDVDITSPANAFAGLSPFSAQVASLTTPAAQVASASATVIVAPVPGVTFTPDRSGTTNPSTPISYTHSLTNTGNVTDTFTFSVQAPPGWTAPVPATLSAVPPGAVRSITVSITPPAGLLAGATGIVTYTVTSGTAPNPSAQVVDTTTIAAIDAATLTPPQQTNSGTAGNPVFFFPTLRNTGSTAIAFDITQIGAGWTAIVTPTTTPILQPGATLPITLSVLIPDGTPINTDNPTTLELRRDGSATVLFTGTYTATTRPLGSLLSPPINTGTALPNATIVYTHTLRNITGQADTFTLRTIATNGWDVAVAPGSVFLEPDETREIQVTVVVPPAKPVGLQDYSYVEVTSVANPAINALGTEITTVGRYAAVQLFDAQSRIVEPGEVVEFQHTLLNQGNALETFTIQAQSEHGWPVEVTVPGGGMVTLLAGASFPVEVRVTVPADVPRDTIDRVQVQASNGAATASVEHVLFYPPLPPVVELPVYKVYLPLVDKP